jgi:peptidoglycan L-alanyl-D-glutamate endopeptidase CwlK
MRDRVTQQRVALLHPLVRAEAAALIDKAEAGFPPFIAIRVVQGLRTFAEQDALYNQPHDGKDNDGDGRIDEADEMVTHSKAGQSYHNYGLAMDFAILYDKDRNGTYETLSWDTVKDEDKDGISDWTEVVRVFKAAGWTWGGDFRSILDKPHVEKTFGRNWRDYLALKTRGQVDAQGYVKI